MTVLGRVAAALLSTLLTLVALDRAIAFFDLAYVPTRGRQNDVRRIERAEFSVDVRLNALGFREPHLPSPKPTGVLRVVALGDPFTQGYGVEEYQAWPRRLETVLDARHPGRYEVVNLGVPGTNPRDYLAHLRDPGLAYEPDVVLVTVMGNDVEDRWVQREFGVHFASDLLVDARRPATFSWPTWWRTRSCDDSQDGGTGRGSSSDARDEQCARVSPHRRSALGGLARLTRIRRPSGATSPPAALRDEMPGSTISCVRAQRGDGVGERSVRDRENR